MMHLLSTKILKVFALILTVCPIFQSFAESESSLRIIGGQPAKQGQFPFLASIQPKNVRENRCGAGILTDRWILSAAHCADFMKPSTHVVYVGSVYISKNGRFYDLEKIIPHVGWNVENGAHDIALFKIQGRFDFNKNVLPINLPININVKPGDVVTAVGWGWTKPTPPGEMLDQLQCLKSKIVSHEKCAAALGNFTIVKDWQICFGGNQGHGTCRGDSGAPLIYTFRNKNYVVGVVSWGIPCAMGKPDIFSRVSYYVPWINENIEESWICEILPFICRLKFLE